MSNLDKGTKAQIQNPHAIVVIKHVTSLVVVANKLSTVCHQKGINTGIINSVVPSSCTPSDVN
jgi:hypothetical protein